MNSLQIRTERPTLDIQTTKARLDIRQRRIRFAIQSTPAKLNITTRRPKMQVDWSGVWAQMGLRKPQQWLEEQRAQSKQAVLDAIANIAQRATMLSRIENQPKGSPSAVSQIAAQQKPSPKLGMVSVPVRSPNVYWEHGDVIIEWDPPELSLNWDVDYTPSISVTPHTIEIRMRGVPKVEITVKAEPATTKGKKIDKAI